MITITAQEIFDTVFTAFVHNGQPPGWSRGGPGDVPSCVYRGTGGSRCAIGLLITDDEYYFDMEGNGVEDLQWELPIRLREHMELLSKLQLAHDGAACQSVRSDRTEPDGNDFASRIRTRLNLVAETKGLSVPAGSE